MLPVPAGLPGADRPVWPAPPGRGARLRHMLTVAAMTVSGIGGGAVVGWVNTPHASADPRVVETTAAFIPAPTGRSVVSAERAVSDNRGSVVEDPTTTTTLARPVAPPTTEAPPARPAETTPAAHTSASGGAGSPVNESSALRSALATRSETPAAPSLGSPSTCGAAIAYLEANSAPGFTFECPGYALGHQAMTCVNVAGVCPGERLIVISTVCEASYMNEAHNSWIIAGYRSGSIDPYGYCDE